jgi:hypothetical protein
MHSGRRVARLVLAGAIALLSPWAGARAKDIRIAVLDIRPLGTESAKAELLSEVALTEAASIRGFDVVGRSDIVALLGFERQRQMLGCGDDSCLAEMGGALGVELIVAGSLGALGDLYRIDLKVVDVKRARVRGRTGMTVEGQQGKLVAAVQQAVATLLAPLGPGAPDGAAAAGTPSAALASDQATLAAATTRGTSVAAPAAAPGGGSISTSAASGSRNRRAGLVVGGAGLALLAGGAVAGVQAHNAYDRERTAAAAGDVASYDRNRSRGKTAAYVANGLYAGGAVALAVGGWLWYSGRPSPAITLDVQPAPGGALAVVSGGF